ncbi:hypothetical protein BAUCODRAFT_26609 [Baudoinia panamericana UAMH 10762]|uniref:F-box domain-containing protein n=1 Tax=Baudoinia panamericana (strain UAMH 10762) TaxID=717646 RepID=M2N2U1_BAUPA|nr:uncharacterized protein BAUCODRAFT_26609 [Baudoinia panamericana UAMH 10762]EMC93294.1 hypothetical protein BAUCODRAFT_26609 [Baudoinia panamericana UAMH 10762]
MQTGSATQYFREAVTRPSQYDSHRAGPSEGILKTIMGLRGLSISDESVFDFEAPDGCKDWPGTRYGPDSPHLQFAKAAKAIRSKRQPPTPNAVRPSKARKPKTEPPSKPTPEPSRHHLPVPKREAALHLLTLPGELRDAIYDLLAIHDGPLYAQIRGVWKPSANGKRRHALAYRRFPQEPSASLANRQLRKEVLSVFYGANRFIYQHSTVAGMRSMISPAAQTIWKFHCTATNHLRHIQLRFDCRGSRWQITYTLRKLADGVITIENSLTDSDYCTCLEDDATEITLECAKDTTDLAVLLSSLCARRRARLDAFAKVEGDSTMYRMPTAFCMTCSKPHVPLVSG